MTRNERRLQRVAFAVDTMQAIKAAVNALHGPAVVSTKPDFVARDIDRAVQLYCAENTADALSYLQRE